jgi:hypothetical protein
MRSLHYPSLNDSVIGRSGVTYNYSNRFVIRLEPSPALPLNAVVNTQRLPLILPPTLSSDPYILALLVHSHAFGHPVRLDYGSGHELGFVLALWRLVRIGWVGAGDDGEKEQDELVLRVFPR